MFADVTMERAFLGSVLSGEGANDHLLATVRPSDFTHDACQRVFLEMNAARLRGTRLDARLVASIAGPQHEGFVSLLLEAVATPLNADEYARRLSELGGLREVARIQGAAVAEEAESLEGAIGEMRQRLVAVETGRSREQMTTADEAVKSYFAELTSKEPEQGVTTGIYSVDQALGRLKPARLYIVAARPGVGKSTLTRVILEHVTLRLKERAALFSLEMLREQVMGCMVSSVGRIDHRLLEHRMHEDIDWVRAGKAASALAAAPLLILDRPGVSMAAIHAAAKTEHLRAPLSLVVVDYLQLVHGSRRKGESREQEVSEVARGLKNMAMDLKVPVIACAQLNREVEKRGDKRPVLADLRESGEIEQSADAVIMLHREWMTDREKPPEEAELLIRKHRFGNLSELRLRFVGQFCRFEAVAP